MKEKLLRSAIFLFTAALIWHVLLPGPAAVRAPQLFFHTGRALLIG
ncbi:hypothetical protein [Phaeodactylibacter luteus]|nr:hypothetical protein [Phaeodactylibacter luteus]